MSSRSAVSRRRVLHGPRLLGVAGICVALSLSALLRYGRPLDAATAVVLVLGLSLVGLHRFGSTARSRWALASVPLLFHLHLHVPLTSDHWQDPHGGRVGVRLFPWLDFGRDGPNTALLEQQLGSLPAEWRHRGPRSNLLWDCRDGNERVNSQSLIWREDYREILALLPNDEARRQVSACLTDTTNLARVHQGLLLTCLKSLGYPQGYDAQSWWAVHHRVFVRVEDPHHVARLVRGWTQSVQRLDTASIDETDPAGRAQIRGQLRAVGYQESGRWGGDGGIREALWDMEAQEARGESPWPSAGRPVVVWWPEHRLPDGS